MRIEFLLRNGQKKLEMIQDPHISGMGHFIEKKWIVFYTSNRSAFLGENNISNTFKLQWKSVCLVLIKNNVWMSGCWVVWDIKQPVVYNSFLLLDTSNQSRLLSPTLLFWLNILQVCIFSNIILSIALISFFLLNYSLHPGHKNIWIC